jgi:predicted aspartyl protease
MKRFFILMLMVIPVIGFAQKISEQSNKQIYLPADLIQGRFFLKIPTVKGDTILGFCDTGGGYTAIYNSTIKKLALESKINILDIGGDTTKYISAKDIYVNRDLPYPQIPNYFKTHIDIPFIQAPDDDKESIFFAKFVNYQIFLGQFFFINNAWTFNYKTGEMSVNTPISKENVDENIQVLGFKKDKMGNKRFGHPRMKLVIDGKMIDFLFDTGATFLLSDSGKAKLGIEANATAGSFIAKSLFNEWHLQHPDWRIIEKGEFTGADLIEVPEVRVGNLTAGPVWFAKRPDEAWSKGMIGSMDKIVKGAIGGSFLKYFKVTIDYNSELIKFEK